MVNESHSNESMREVNILLLGETGVGKSTWINAFANYLTYDTLKDATQGDLVVLIPSKFTLTNKKAEIIEMAVGESDVNEVHAWGQTGTQNPISYAFKTKDLLVRIIDTTGVGDTRGIEQDKQNFRTLMNHLSHVDFIHGICILLQPNNSHMSIFFQYCLTQILKRLHQDSTKNIAFCFTNARGTSYCPGDTMSPLKSFLTKGFTAQILIPREERTVYCVDNEAFRFLAALKHGVKYDDKQRQDFSNSWQISANEMGRMIEHYLSVQPHATANTVTLNAIWQVSEMLAKPLAEATQNIQTNIKLIRDKVEELHDMNLECKYLNFKLKIPQLDVVKVELTHPRTVCTDLSCTEKIPVYPTSVEEEQIFITSYKQVCHDPCNITRVAANQPGCALLRGCAAMMNGTCHNCHHGYEKHMYITHETIAVVVDVIDQNVQNDLRTTEERIQVAVSAISQSEVRNMEYETEQRTIMRTGAKFAVYLKKNSITPYNNAIIRDLKHMTKLEEDKVNRGGVKTTAEQLKKLRGVYVAEEKILQEAMKAPDGGNISLEDVQHSLDALYSLPLTGQTIKNSLCMTTNGSDKFCYIEKAYTPKRKREGVGLYAKMSNMTVKAQLRNCAIV